MTYSLENAKKFGWSSVSGSLNPERVSCLEKFLVGNEILDAGCAGGAYVEFLCNQGLHVTGVDTHQEFLDVATTSRHSGNYIKTDILKLPFSDKTFDCTYCFDVLEHINDVKALKELIRVTKHRIIITVPKEDEQMGRYNLTFLHYQDKTHLRNYTESSLKRLAIECGVSNLAIYPELQVPLKNLLKEMIEENNSNPLEDLINKYIINVPLKIFLKLSKYKKIYTSLLAIIDL